jgi:hypothetical protein
LILGLAKGGQHDYFCVAQFWRVAQNIEHLEAAYARHHNVGYD